MVTEPAIVANEPRLNRAVHSTLIRPVQSAKLYASLSSQFIQTKTVPAASPPCGRAWSSHSFAVSCDAPKPIEVGGRSQKMPPYDCMLLFKPHVKKEALISLVARIGKHVCKRNGVVTEVKSFGTVQLGYGVKKRDGRFFQGQMMQVSMMATPEINKELHYLNKEDKLLRWLLVKQRDTKFGLDFMSNEGGLEPSKFSLINKPDDEDDDGNEDDEEYEVNEEENKVN